MKAQLTGKAAVNATTDVASLCAFVMTGYYRLGFETY